MGRLEEIKGVDVLLKAWKLLGAEAPELLICGKGPLEDWAKGYIEQNQLSKVKLLGFVENTKVKKLIAESKALILPTQVYEGFPMTIAESYACGTPVIASELGNTGSLIENGKSGWKVNPGMPKELAECVLNAQNITKDVAGIFNSKYTAKQNYEILSQIYQRIS